MNSEDINFYLLLALPYLLLFALACVLIPKLRRAIARRIEAFDKHLIDDLIIEADKLPIEIKGNIPLMPHEQLLLSVFLFPKVRQIKNNGILTNFMLISTERLHFMHYIKGKGIQQSTRLLFSEIDSIEAKTKEVAGLFKRPFISISILGYNPITIFVPGNRKGSQNIKRVLDAFRKSNKALTIIGEVPADLRSERIKKMQDNIANKIDGDLNDLFK